MATKPCEIGLVLVLAAAVCALPPGRGAARAQAPTGLEILENNTVVRRVCVQDGVPTFQAPERTARIPKDSGDLPAHLGGGTYVTVTGERTNGYEQVRTLTGDVVWIPETQPATNARTLCLAQPSVMRVCWGETAGQTIAVYENFAVLTASAIAFLDRGSLVQLWGYFEDQGRWAFVEKNGQVGFVRSAELCHETSMPPDTEATSHFGMTVAAANPRCFQQRTRAASEIRRIVIHNSRHTLGTAIGTSQSCDSNRPASAHVGIDRDGRMYRFVEDRFAAFHTGGHHGGFDASSLGIELMASKAMQSITPEQEQSLVALIRFWSKKYGIAPESGALDNSTRVKNYANVEFWSAPITIHRFTSAGRDTECPAFVWTDSARGDDEFFEWRRSHFTPDAGHP